MQQQPISTTVYQFNSSAQPQMQLLPQPQQQVQNPAFAPLPRNVFQRNYQRQFIILGVIQLVAVIVFVTFFEVWLYVVDSSYGFSRTFSSVITCLVLATGVMGIVAGCKKTKCSIVAFLVLCVLSSIVAIAADMTIFVMLEFGYHRRCYGYEDVGECHREHVTRLALEWCMGVSGLVEIIAVIWAASLASSIVCCTKAADQTTATRAYYLNPSSQVLLMEQPGQEMICLQGTSFQNQPPGFSSQQPGIGVSMRNPIEEYPAQPPAYSHVPLLPNCPPDPYNDFSEHKRAL